MTTSAPCVRRGHYRSPCWPRTRTPRSPTESWPALPDAATHPICQQTGPPHPPDLLHRAIGAPARPRRTRHPHRMIHPAAPPRACGGAGHRDGGRRRALDRSRGWPGPRPSCSTRSYRMARPLGPGRPARRSARPTPRTTHSPRVIQARLVDPVFRLSGIGRSGTPPKNSNAATVAWLHAAWSIRITGRTNRCGEQDSTITNAHTVTGRPWPVWSTGPSGRVVDLRLLTQARLLIDGTPDPQLEPAPRNA
jgi:hypothetical protein